MKKNFLLSIALLASAIVSAQPAPSSFEQTWKAGPDRSLRNGVIYQVYPSSYKDSDGNGIGDIQGVISKLDYIENLGVSVIWFNPLFISGWIDGGYDVIDFYRVDQRFGTNNDFVELIQKAPDKKPSLAVEHGQNIAELERVPAIKRADRSEKEQGCHFLILVDSDWYFQRG